MERYAFSHGGVDENGLRELMAFIRANPVKEYVVVLPVNMWESLGKPDRIGGYEVRLNNSLDSWEAIVQEKDLYW